MRAGFSLEIFFGKRRGKKRGQQERERRDGGSWMKSKRFT